MTEMSTNENKKKPSKLVFALNIALVLILGLMIAVVATGCKDEENLEGTVVDQEAVDVPADHVPTFVNFNSGDADLTRDLSAKVLKGIMSGFSGQDVKAKLDRVYGGLKNPEGVLSNLNDVEKSINKILTAYSDKACSSVLAKRDAEITNINNENIKSMIGIIKAVKKNPNDMETVKEELSYWATKEADGKLILDAVAEMADVFANSNAGGKTLPDIYDAAAYKAYPWEHEAYEFREACRNVDMLSLATAFCLAQFYYEINPDELDYEESRYALGAIIDSMDIVEATMNKKAIKYHDDFLICQIDGCEYAFYKKFKYIDFYTKGKEVLLGQALHPSNDDKPEIVRMTTDMLDDIFYNAYIYEDPQLTKPLSISYSQTKDFGYEVKYLPQSSYKALYKYYNGETGTEHSIYNIFKDLGFECVFDENTGIVCNYKERFEYEPEWLKEWFYCNAFAFKIFTKKSDSDYYNVTCCLKDDVSLNGKMTVAHEAWYSPLSYKINKYGTREKYIFCAPVAYRVK